MRQEGRRAGRTHRAKDRFPRVAGRLTQDQLETLLAEALADCYNESEELMGLYTMIEDNLAFPLTTRVLDVEVEVERLDLNDAGEVVAVCRRGKARQRLPILDLPLPDPVPQGWEWIEAYRYWGRERR